MHGETGPFVANLAIALQPSTGCEGYHWGLRWPTILARSIPQTGSPDLKGEL
jgi:hypothetical protein